MGKRILHFRFSILWIPMIPRRAITIIGICIRTRSKYERALGVVLFRFEKVRYEWYTSLMRQKVIFISRMPSNMMTLIVSISIGLMFGYNDKPYRKLCKPCIRFTNQRLKIQE